jgi:hypothetical protein
MEDVANTATRDAWGLIQAYHRGAQKDFGAILRPHVGDHAYHAELLMGLSGIALTLAEIVAARTGKPVEDFLEETALGLAEEFS